MSTDTDIDMQYDSAVALPQAYWDWRNWSAAFSSPVRRCQSGCWMTTWTLRHCWRRSETTKWPPSSLTPMLLSPISSLRRSGFRRSIRSSQPPTHGQHLKFLLDTIHTVTLKLNTFPSYISVREIQGHAQLAICKIIRQLSQSSTGYTFVVVTELTSIFTSPVLQSSGVNNISAYLPATITYTLKKVFDKRTSFAGMQCRC